MTESWRRYRVVAITCIVAAIAGIAPIVLEVSTNERELAIVSFAMIFVQGFAIWLMLRGEAEERNLLLQRARTMLKDRVRNKLQIAALADTKDEVFKALNEIDNIINGLSDRDILAWEEHYDRFPFDR